ncbi:MAG: hypothetical protein ACYC0X_10155 [Pirellulaceae bacterium]
MYCWLTVLILSAGPPAPMEYRDADILFRTGFEQDADLNFDSWPDDWTRRRCEGFPQYLPIAITEDPQDQTSRCLRMELDGGAATIYSAPIEIDPMFSFLLQGKLKTQQLQHDVAYYSLTFFESLEQRQEQKRESYHSPELTDVPVWQEVQIGPLTPSNAKARFAVIGLHVIPTGRADLQGAAMFDDIRFARLPCMSIRSNQPQNIFVDPQDVELTCSVAGIRQPTPMLHLELQDETGRPLATDALPMEAVAVAGNPREMAEERSIAELIGPNATDATAYAASVTWRVPVPGPGFYSVRATLRQEDALELQHAMSLVVMRPRAERSAGEYGWSLPDRTPPLAIEQLLKLLDLAHVSRVKCPVACDPTDQGALDQLVALADQLGTRGIEMVGVFDEVPPETRKKFTSKDRPTVADVFLEPKIWQPLMDPLMTRLSMQVQYWQLGSDGDNCLVDIGGLEGLLRGISQHLEQSGHRTRLGLAWPWIHEVPATVDAPWDFLALSESAPFTHRELERYSAAATTPGTSHWITLRPLPQLQYTVAQRARDLVLRMLAAKTQGATAIFASNPFDDAQGLMNRDGTPGELFLPWCTTAGWVGGAQYVGTIQLPNGSPNYLFARNGEAILVVWNELPVNETLYLGEQVGQYDLWGREIPLSASSESSGTITQTLTAGPLPTFLTGLDLAVARWQVDCVLEPDQLASVTGSKQAIRLRLRNTFPRNVSGSATLRVPATWDLETSTFEFRLAENEQQEETLDIMLQADACAGPQRVQIDFEIEAERRYQFSLYRDIYVGSGDLVADFASWLDADGQLIVEQHLTNNAPYPLNLNCYLYAPGRRRARQQILDMAPGRITRSFMLPDGQELLGQPLWFRVEEIGGSRGLNYQINTQP